MKHIEKHFDNPVVVKYENELRQGKLDEQSLKDPDVHKSSDGPAIYDMVKSMKYFNALRNRMVEEQGAICCYCGRRLEYPNHPQYIVEHVYPKEADRTIAGEYKNLLLSCRPSDEEENERKKTKKSEQKKFFHCDKSKSSQKIKYSPLMEDCADYFVYDEFGNVEGTDDDAQKDIEILNLKCDWLKRHRLAAIEGEIYDENMELISDDELQQRIHSIMERDEQGRHSEYCFAVSGAIKHLLC